MLYFVDSNTKSITAALLAAQKGYPDTPRIYNSSWFYARETSCDKNILLMFCFISSSVGNFPYLICTAVDRCELCISNPVNFKGWEVK
jgi:hypothetical protein